MNTAPQGEELTEGPRDSEGNLIFKTKRQYEAFSQIVRREMEQYQVEKVREELGPFESEEEFQQALRKYRQALLDSLQEDAMEEDSRRSAQG